MNLKILALTLVLLAPMALAASPATTIDVAMDKATYSVADTLVGGVSPVATVTITQLVDGETVPLAGAAVTVTFLRQVQLVGFVSSETVTGTTDEDGVFVATAPQLSGAPGHYLVAVFAAGTSGSTSYDVGA